MPDKFEILNDSAKHAISAEVKPHLPVGYQDLKIIQVLKGAHRFYPGWDFFELQNKDDLEQRPICLFKKGLEICVLDWQALTLLSFNRRAPLSLDLKNIIPYVRFFFDHVRFAEGQMILVESYDDIGWHEEPAGRVKQALSSLITAAKLISWDEGQGRYEVEASIMFERSLFTCRLLITKDGDITITDRRLQVEDMPVLDESGL